MSGHVWSIVEQSLPSSQPRHVSNWETEGTTPPFLKVLVMFSQLSGFTPWSAWFPCGFLVVSLWFPCGFPFFRGRPPVSGAREVGPVAAGGAPADRAWSRARSSGRSWKRRPNRGDRFFSGGIWGDLAGVLVWTMFLLKGLFLEHQKGRRGYI